MYEQLIKNAQELVVTDNDDNKMSLMPLEVFDIAPEHAEVIECQTDSNCPTIEIELKVLPGVDGESPDPEPLEVSEEEPEKKDDENDAKSKKNEKWSWEKHGPTGFIAWIKERCDNVPKHSGQDTAGLERAMAYLERLDNEISKAMRLDLDGELDANQIEKVRATIDHGVERLTERLDKIRVNKKQSRKKKADPDEIPESFVKEAQKITGVQGVYVTIPLLISGIARVCINSMVSAGHSIEYTYANQVKKYGLNEREQSEVRWLLNDLGYAMRGDRGFMPDEDFDATSSDNLDYSAQYNA